VNTNTDTEISYSDKQKDGLGCCLLQARAGAFSTAFGGNKPDRQKPAVWVSLFSVSDGAVVVYLCVTPAVFHKETLFGNQTV